MPTGQVWSSSTIMVPVPMRLPAFGISVKSMGVSRCSSTMKVGGGPAGQQSAKLHAVAHSSRMLLENFADGGAHGQFPQARALHFSARAV